MTSYILNVYVCPLVNKQGWDPEIVLAGPLKAEGLNRAAQAAKKGSVWEGRPPLIKGVQGAAPGKIYVTENVFQANLKASVSSHVIK